MDQFRLMGKQQKQEVFQFSKSTRTLDRVLRVLGGKICLSKIQFFDVFGVSTSQCHHHALEASTRGP